MFLIDGFLVPFDFSMLHTDYSQYFAHTCKFLQCGPHPPKGWSHATASAQCTPHACQHLVLADEHSRQSDALEMVMVNFMCQFGQAYSGCFWGSVSG